MPNASSVIEALFKIEQHFVLSNQNLSSIKLQKEIIVSIQALLSDLFPFKSIPGQNIIKEFENRYIIGLLDGRVVRTTSRQTHKQQK